MHKHAYIHVLSVIGKDCMFHLADTQLELLDFHNSLGHTLCNPESNVIF